MVYGAETATHAFRIVVVVDSIAPSCVDAATMTVTELLDAEGCIKAEQQPLIISTSARAAGKRK